MGITSVSFFFQNVDASLCAKLVLLNPVSASTKVSLHQVLFVCRCEQLDRKRRKVCVLGTLGDVIAMRLKQAFSKRG